MVNVIIKNLIINSTSCISNLNFKVNSMFNQLEILSDEQSEKLYTIRRYIKNLDSVCIDYSGGVDSTLVA